MESVAWRGVEGENENRFVIYLNFWYVDFPLSVTKKNLKKNIFPDIFHFLVQNYLELLM